MKRIVLMIATLIVCISMAKAQTYTIQVTPELGFQQIFICLNQYDNVEIYAIDGCNPILWETTVGDFTDNPLVLYGTQGDHIGISFYGCGYNIYFSVDFVEPNVPNETSTTLWKHQGYPITLEAVGEDSLSMYNIHWNTDEATGSIDVTAPGTYTCEISDLCDAVTLTFIVHDNVELYRATVDLETKLNKATWQTTPEQAEYISEVKVERDGMVVGTAPYGQGYFLDNIGSENAARNYRLTAITTDGTECPIPSYQKGTLHVDYSPNASNPNKLNMAWTPPFIEEGASISVSYFQICKYDPATGEVTVVDQLGANNTIGSYDVNLFDGGYAVVAAMFNEGKEYEELAFSNLTDFLVGIEENEGPSTDSGTLTVYPNPANGVLYVETRHATSLPVETYRIVNPIGQTVMEGQITSEKQQIDVRDLPQGVYFITVGGATRKFVVE